MKKLFYVEFLFVRFEIILDDKFGKLSVFDLENGGLLAFELFVNPEKVRHFFHNMRRQFLDFLVSVPSGIFERNRDDFVIHLAAVLHHHNAYRIAPYQRKRDDRLRTKHEYVERVVVLAVSARDKTVVCGIVRRGEPVALSSSYLFLLPLEISMQARKSVGVMR